MLKGRLTNLFESNRFIDGHLSIKKIAKESRARQLIMRNQRILEIQHYELSRWVLWKPMSNTLIRQNIKKTHEET